MMPNMPKTAGNALESAVTPSQEDILNQEESASQEGPPDFAQGYQIILTVKPDGFEVRGPSPLPQESPEPHEDEDQLPDLTTALKHVIAIHKEHPVDSDLNGHFRAGYDQ